MGAIDCVNIRCTVTVTDSTGELYYELTVQAPTASLLRRHLVALRTVGAFHSGNKPSSPKTFMMQLGYKCQGDVWVSTYLALLGFGL